MSLTALLLALAGEAELTLDVPSFHVAGAPFAVHLALVAPEGGAELESWRVTAAAFALDGRGLGERKGGTLRLAAGERQALDVALELPADVRDFELAWCDRPARRVRVLAPAPRGLAFLDEAAVPAAELARYWVLLATNRGDMLLEFWPEVAPNHVRNFLELCGRGFYDDLTFHRVLPGFMIQGGDPDGSGSGRGPRRLAPEFSDRPHRRGVLSMARGPELDSASCQFFLLHADAAHLDGSYSAFGRVVNGLATLDRIATAPGSPLPAGGNRPYSPQVILRASVVAAPADPASFQESK